jgi:hypothetical protein
MLAVLVHDFVEAAPATVHPEAPPVVEGGAGDLDAVPGVGSAVSDELVLNYVEVHGLEVMPGSAVPQP